MNDIQKKNLWGTLTINLIVLVVYLLFFNIILEGNDEFAFSAFLSGAYRFRSVHLVFSNIFYGEFLKFFYCLGMNINWYSIFELLFCFLAFWTISYIIFMKLEKYKKSKIYILICFVFLMVFGYHHYYLMQWTKSAYLISLAGVTLILYVLHMKKTQNIGIIVGGILVLVGSFIRFDTVLVVFAFLFIRFLYDLLIEQKFKFEKNYFKGSGKYIITFGLLLCLVFGFRIADKLVYKYGPEHEQWRHYEQYNILRSEIMDYGIPKYEDAEQQYQNIGLSEVDIKMLKNWNFSDSEVFSVEMFQKIVNLKEKKSINLKIIIETFKNILKGAPKKKIGIFTSIVVLLCLVNGDKKRKLLIFMYTILLFLLYAYLTYMDRVIFRCEYGIWICLLVFSLYNYDYSKNDKIIKNRICKGSWICLSLVICAISLYDYQSRHDIYMEPLKTEYRDLFDYTSKHKENIYMRDVSTLCDWNQGFSPLEALPYGYLSNIYLLGGWEIENPITDVKQNYAISNPWRECVDSENIFIIDNVGIELKLAYIQQRYCETAEAVLVDEIAGFKIYQIVSHA